MFVFFGLFALARQSDSEQTPLEALYLANLRGGSHRVDVNDPDVIMAAQFMCDQFAKDPTAPSKYLEVHRINFAQRQAITQDTVQYIIQMDLADEGTGVFRLVGTATEEFGKGFNLVNISPSPRA
eukprot:c4536_g1_i2.p1 GENE.c4536_g1_i2~~c4536_g1_i2.p1  ORF type:complete len:125 (-),score=21.82 c4536_g1_i2:76-450(-)